MVEQNFTTWVSSLQPWLVNIINSGDSLESKDTITKGADLCIEQISHNVRPNNITKTLDYDKPHRIVINSIHSTSNIFALRDDLCIDFNSKITVVYGVNGAGKTSIVKLLDYANGGNIDIAKNKFKKGKKEQNYIIDFLDNDIKKSFSLVNNSEHIKIDIFDAERGNRILVDGKQLSVEAVELKIIQELTRYCDNVKKELKYRVNNLLESREQMMFPIEYKGTNAEAVFNSLTESSVDKVEKILAGIEWTEKHQNILDKTIAELDADNRVKEIMRIDDRIENIRIAVSSIESIIKIFTNDAFAILKKQKEKLLADYITAREYSEKIFEKSELGDIGSNTWKRMWEAARDYSKQVYPDQSFPVVEGNAVCVLCHQPLSKEAQVRLEGFEEYVNSSFESRLKESQKVVANNELLATQENIELIESQLCVAIGNEYMSKYKESIDELSYISVWANEQKQIENPFKIISFDKCKQLIEDLKKTLSELKGKKEKIINDEKVKVKEKERQSLEGQKWLATQLPLFMRNSQLQTEADEYLHAIKLTSTNRLTSKAKELSEELLTDNYETAFNKALVMLGATNLHAHLIAGQASKGRGSFQIVLENDEGEKIKAEDVLSTGEKRVVSLAAFIADAVNKEDEIPFIFDDPVSSLDSDYEKRVADALSKLAERRQVIVFTHRLSLMSALREYENVQFVELYRNDPVGCGVVDYNPAITITKTADLKKSLKELKRRVQELNEEMENDPHATGYRERLDGIVAKFRTLIESTIEIVLLDRIVTRFNKEVRSTKVKGLTSITKEECETIDSLMSKYSEQEHSQSPETPCRIISSIDVQNDIETMLDLIDNHNKPSKKQ